MVVIYGREGVMSQEIHRVLDQLREDILQVLDQLAERVRHQDERISDLYACMDATRRALEAYEEDEHGR